MNICVCVKQIEETYARTGKDSDQFFIDAVDRIFRVNPYDEAAMALALNVAAGHQNARITVLTLGPLLSEDDMWRIMGMGADHLCHIEPVGLGGKLPLIDSWGKAQALAEATLPFNPDIILCGKESMDLQNGLVAGFISHLLKRPFISAIVDLEHSEDAAIARVTKSIGKGRREILDCRLPAVFSVDLFPGALFRPSYEAKKRARDEKTVTHMIFNSRTLTNRTHRIELKAPRPRSKPVMAPDSNLPSFERVRQLLAGSRIQKKGEIVSGSTESEVAEIIKFLEEKNLISISEHGEPSD